MSEQEQAIEAEVTPEVEAPLESVEVDLSAVPENARDYVDVDKYTSNDAYRQAIEHGWKPRELHEAEGGDPDDWTGPNQFVRRYEDRQREKDLKSSISEMQKQQQALLDTFQAQQEKAVADALAQREAQFRQAVEEGETEQALGLQNEINDLKSAQTQAVQQGQMQEQEPPVVLKFRANNDVFNPLSERFDPILNGALETAVAQEWDKIPEASRKHVDENRMQAILDDAHQTVKEKFNLSKPQRKSPSVSKPSNSKPKVDPVTQLTGTSKAIYNDLLEKQGKEAADDFAARMTGGE